MKNFIFLNLFLFLSSPVYADKPCKSSKATLCLVNSTQNNGFPSTKINKLINIIKNAKINVKNPLKSNITSKLDKYFDFNFMAKAALQYNWKQLNSNQQNQYVVAFKKMLKFNYIKKLSKHKKFKIKIISEKLKGKRARVAVKLTKKNSSNEVPIQIIYKMKKSLNGWVIYDVITDEVSLVKNYRSVLKKLLKRKGFDHLINYLKKQTK